MRHHLLLTLNIIAHCCQLTSLSLSLSLFVYSPPLALNVITLILPSTVIQKHWINIHIAAMNVLKYLAAITLVLSIIHASVAIDDGDRKQLLRSKLIATLDHDRKLGGSKSSKAFGGKGNKKSAKSSKASRQSSDGSKPSTQSNANKPGKKQIFNKSGKNSAKSNKSGKNFAAAKSSKSSSSHQAGKPNPPATVRDATVRDSDSTPELILNDFDFTFPTSASNPSSISDSSTNTGSNNSDEDVVRQFLDNENEYHGLQAQNLAVGIVAALAVTATIAAVALKRKGKSLWPKGRVAENTGALDAGGMPANATTVKPAAVKSGDAAATPVANNDTFCPQDTWFDSISSCWA